MVHLGRIESRSMSCLRLPCIYKEIRSSSKSTLTYILVFGNGTAKHDKYRRGEADERCNETSRTRSITKR